MFDLYYYIIRGCENALFTQNVQNTCRRSIVSGVEYDGFRIDNR